MKGKKQRLIGMKVNKVGFNILCLFLKLLCLKKWKEDSILISIPCSFLPIVNIDPFQDEMFQNEKFYFIVKSWKIKF
jgi:hypothetical protein